MEKTVRHGLLLDFYGGLLTEKQREVLGAYFEDDLSLGEIAEEQGVTRAAVHDLIKRSVASLEEFEARLGLVSREERLRLRLREISEAVDKASMIARDRGVADIAKEIDALGREFLAVFEDE